MVLGVVISSGMVVVVMILVRLVRLMLDRLMLLLFEIIVSVMLMVSRFSLGSWLVMDWKL